MAQILKEEIEKNIFRAAIDEFYTMGYQSATLRNIAEEAGIPVGLIYTYYKNKAALFAAVVNPTYLSFQKILSTASSPESNPGYDKFFHEELPFIFTMLKNNRKPFIILIDKSKGTVYENAREELILLTQIHIQAQLQHKLIHCEKKVDDLFYHILANNFMEGLFEIARHYKDEKWADHIMKLFIQQYFYGINSVIV
ncbi:TetR/AcrR family transcriptional regulator [Sporomusa acidovorans]|uniref:HTH tetR-type domain-containing protein n=1 Tax=Sporomusa acidovorans (strain ATCC 49682 / DSM 3132 / Mol) TaxID=1123286 RepID=A0ABZ3IY41_SPOA4|nr:TetR/AcrR family transcriptional regulator [Sporomusa acidovorans]OZC16956.1 HTH-type transcriptional repressor Bm3R1 [Sporomusa acidovorans DSM 3132]SDE13688.1 transcriptional regulator, TetR family [Sporomusa acidovorans]